MEERNRVFSGRRLEDARKEIGLTISALSNLTKVSRTTLSRLENGALLHPTSETVFAIASALKKGYAFFFPSNEIVMKETTIPSFRSLQSKSKLSNDQAMIQLRKCELVIQCLYKFVMPRFLDLDEGYLESIDPLNLHASDIEDIAAEIRDKWGLGTGAIRPLITILENHGIICSRANLPDNVDSINISFRSSEGAPETSLILFKSSQNYFRQRFSLAHELGHIVLHHCVTKEELEKNTKEFEMQANRFASSFLMPAQKFIESTRKTTLDGATEIKMVWGTSAQAILRRFLDTGLITESKFSYLQREVSRRGWKRQEPLDAKTPAESPYYLRAGFSFIFDNGLASIQDILDYCCLTPLEITSFVENKEKFFQDVPNAVFFPV